MKHVLRILKSLFIFVLVKLPITISAFIIVPIAVLFTLKDRRVASDRIRDQRLPKILTWYDNGDHRDRKYGLNGDIPRQMGYFNINIDDMVMLDEALDKGVDEHVRIQEAIGITLSKIYMARVKWLLRNPVNYFQYHVLGLVVKNPFENTALVQKLDFEEFEDLTDYATGGYRYREFKNGDGKLYYEYYWIYPYYKELPDRCFRIRIGHKLGMADEVKGDLIQFTFNFHPFHGYTGKKK